jgi:hypothetical protein
MNGNIHGSAARFGAGGKHIPQNLSKTDNGICLQFFHAFCFLPKIVFSGKSRSRNF